MRFALVVLLVLGLTGLNAQNRVTEDNTISKEQAAIEQAIEQSEADIHSLMMEKNEIRLALKYINEHPASSKEEVSKQKQEKQRLVAKREQLDQQIASLETVHKEKTIQLKELKNKINK